MAKQIRFDEGRKISTLAEVAKLDKGLFIGNASNYWAYAYDKNLYNKNDLYGPQPVYLEPKHLNRINLFIGAQGSGKSKAVDVLIHNHPDHHMLIYDPNRERVTWAYDENRDILICHADSRGVLWDVIGECIANPRCANTIFMAILRAVRGEGNSNDQQWDRYALSKLYRLISMIRESGRPRNEWYMVIAAAWAEIEAECTNEMDQSKLGTAQPVYSLFFQIYYIGAHEERKWIKVEDIEDYRRIFLLGHPMYHESLTLINNAFVAMVSNYVMGRDEVTPDQFHKYWFFIWEEFLTLDLDEKMQEDLNTQCRKKGIIILIVVQVVDKERKKIKEKLSAIKASRYLTVCFGTGDEGSAKLISEMTEPVKYQKREDRVSENQGGLLSIFGGGQSETENWTKVETNIIPHGLVMALPRFVAYVEVRDLDKGSIKMFLKAPLVESPKNQPEFMFSEVAKHAPEMEEVL